MMPIPLLYAITAVKRRISMFILFIQRKKSSPCVNIFALSNLSRIPLESSQSGQKEKKTGVFSTFFEGSTSISVEIKERKRRTPEKIKANFRQNV